MGTSDRRLAVGTLLSFLLFRAPALGSLGLPRPVPLPGSATSLIGDRNMPQIGTTVDIGVAISNQTDVRTTGFEAYAQAVAKEVPCNKTESAQLLLLFHLHSQACAKRMSPQSGNYSKCIDTDADLLTSDCAKFKSSTCDCLNHHPKLQAALSSPECAFVKRKFDRFMACPASTLAPTAAPSTTPTSAPTTNPLPRIVIIISSPFVLILVLFLLSLFPHWDCVPEP